MKDLRAALDKLTYDEQDELFYQAAKRAIDRVNDQALQYAAAAVAVQHGKRSQEYYRAMLIALARWVFDCELHGKSLGV